MLADTEMSGGNRAGRWESDSIPYLVVLVLTGLLHV